MKKELGVTIIVLVILIPIIVILSQCQYNAADRDINNKVEAIGGTIISIDSKLIGPFIVSKNDRVYKFVYMIDGQRKIGWYKQGFFDKWILDYKGEKNNE